PGGLTWERVDDEIVFTLPLRNTGNTTLSPTVDLELRGWPGSPASLAFDAPESILPGGTYDATATMSATPPAFIGEGIATIRSEAGVETVVTQVLYVPLAFLAIGAIVLVILAFCSWRIVRFVRRARYALAQLERNPQSGPAL
ncbi:MAG TPA: DUF916 domain-containing protein, partial [Homoserinimonas sp.]|nr:DUF916 domain-containing protein [Homoserinimonas sp.]